MFPISAINDNESSRSQSLAPTKEAQESHLTKLYQDALLHLQASDLTKARSLFQAIIHDPLSIRAQRETAAKNDPMLHLRFLTYRNLAETYVKQGPDFYKDGLQCYIQAVTIDEKDVVLWNRLGTLACSLGQLNIARKAFEQGLHCSPRHWSCMEKLAEVLIAIGDETSCLSVVNRLLKLHPSHPRALHIKTVIQQQVNRGLSDTIHVVGIDNLEPKHSNLSFVKKRKLDVTTDISKPVKRKQHCIQLSFAEPSWLLVVKAALDAFKNREQGKILKSEQLKDRGSYLANSRVLFSVQSSVDVGRMERSSDVVKLPDSIGIDLNKVASLSSDAVQLDEKVSPCKNLESEEHHERRSTRLERLRSRKIDKTDEAIADCPKSLKQLLDPFVIEHFQAESEKESCGMDAESTAFCKRVDGCLVYSTSNECTSTGDEVQHILEAEDVLQFTKDYTDNSGLYHVAQAILEKVCKNGHAWKEHSGFLLELEKNTRQWGRSRSSTCNLFLAELYLDAAAAAAESIKLSDHLSNCNYNICRVVECLALDVEVDDKILKSSIQQQRSGWIFWARFHWLNGRYCMFSGNSSKGFSEFRKCLSLLEAQREVYAAVVLPHCKVDCKISLETVEQKLYEFEVGDLLTNAAAKLQEQGNHAELIQMLVPALFSARTSKSNGLSGKCTEGLESPEFKALNMLIGACQNVKPVNFPVQLKCRLRKLEMLCHYAGILSSKAEDELPLSPASGVPSSVDLDGEKAKETKTWNKKIADEVKHLSRCAASLREKMADYAAEPALPFGRFQHVLLMVLMHFGSGLSCRRHSNLSLTDQLESSYIVETAVAFCRIQHLCPTVSPDEQVALLVTVHELLAERGVCGSGVSCEDGEGSFLRMAIKHLLAMKQEVAKGNEQEAGVSVCSSASDGEKKSEVLEKIKRVEPGLDSALDQCFFCLYGLNVKADLELGPCDHLAVHKTTTCGEFRTKEQCAEVLQYILPYAKANSKAGLAKLKQVLQAVRKQFPQPPSKILVGNVVDTFMDDLSFDEVKFAEMVLSKTNIDELFRFAFPKQEEEPATAVVIYSTPTGELRTEQTETETLSESYTEVHQNLYYLLTQVEDMAITDKSPGFILTKEGEDFIQQNASLYKYDLLYTMKRYDSWQKLASIYDEEVDSLLNDGSKNVNVLDWRKNNRLTSRVENSRRRSRRCFLMSLALANNSSEEFQSHELLALVYYDTIQNSVPMYDQRSLVQRKDTVWIARCINAMKHFEAAYSQRPDWTHLYYLGKLSEKLGKPSEESFSLYKRTIQMNPAAVDPLYRLHRSRLKWLCRGRCSDVSIIEAVAKYCFQNATGEMVNAKLNALKQPDGNFEQVDDEARRTETAALWNLLFKDCILAMQACIDGEMKHFHKARFCIAQSLHQRAEDGDWERAKEELAFCFRTGRSLFTINMWELDGVVPKKHKRKPTGSMHAKKNLELGIPECSRKFITCVRKYLLLYIVLCEKAGDVVTLERAYTTLKNDKRFSICLEDIANVARKSYLQAVAAAINQQERTACASNSDLQTSLERMFNVFMEHGVSWPDISDTDTKEEDAEKLINCYIHRYIHYLENDSRVDILELLNERIRKRFKNPKVTNPHFSQICRHATLAWCRALCSGLAAITPLERAATDQPSQLIVDLQYDALFSTPYDTEVMSRISQVSVAGSADETGGLPPSAAQIARIKRVPVLQVSGSENADKAQSLLRATFVFYREVTSGPFASGIHLYSPSSGSAAPSDSTAGNFTMIPGFERIDLSTPRILLLWAFALVHGRPAGIGDVVKYCEEQAKTRLKKWPAAAAHTQSATQEKSNACSSRIGGDLRGEVQIVDVMDINVKPEAVDLT